MKFQFLRGRGVKNWPPASPPASLSITEVQWGGGGGHRGSGVASTLITPPPSPPRGGDLLSDLEDDISLKALYHKFISILLVTSTFIKQYQDKTISTPCTYIVPPPPSPHAPLPNRPSQRLVVVVRHRGEGLYHHAPQRMSVLRDNNLPLRPVHPPPRHPISTFQVVAPGQFRDWSLITWRGV